VALSCPFLRLCAAFAQLLESTCSRRKRDCALDMGVVLLDRRDGARGARDLAAREPTHRGGRRCAPETLQVLSRTGRGRSTPMHTRNSSSLIGTRLSSRWHTWTQERARESGAEAAARSSSRTTLATPSNTGRELTELPVPGQEPCEAGAHTRARRPSTPRSLLY
jgi:hypothetical protein